MNPVRITCRPKLLLEFVIFWRVSRARKLHAIAVRISHRHNPQAVSHRWACPSLNSARFELAIQRQRVFALKAKVDSCSQRFLRLAFGQKLLQHDCSLAKLQPTPANLPISLVMILTIRLIWNPPALHSEPKPVHIESQRRFHVAHVEKRHRLLYIRSSRFRQASVTSIGLTPHYEMEAVALQNLYVTH